MSISRQKAWKQKVENREDIAEIGSSVFTWSSSLEVPDIWQNACLVMRQESGYTRQRMAHDVCLNAVQVSEVEALQAIYCGENEFHLHTPDLISQLKDPQTDGSSSSGKMVEFTLQLTVRSLEQSEPSSPEVQLHVKLPDRYPEVPPVLLVTTGSRDIDRLLVEDLSEYARHLTGEAMVMKLALHLQENVTKYFKKQGGSNVGMKAAREETRLRACLVRIDHMRSKSRYIKSLTAWMAELDINGFLLFYGKLILMLVEGRSENVKIYFVRHRTVNVDVDSSGRPCKERMLTCLWDEQQETQRFLQFDVIEANSVDQLENRFSKAGLLSMYQDFVLPLLK